MVDVRLIIDPPQSGPWNMAVDEVLLMDAVENGVATLRFYQWSEPTLSLGYFQHYADREQHAASRDCIVVRRQTGGGAILHDRELTYSFALPGNIPLARQAADLYATVHNNFIAALAANQPAATATSTLRIRGDQPSPVTDSPSAEPFLCFQRRSPGDVILLQPSQTDTKSPTIASDPGTGWKVLGSAQRRHRGAILQHGSLLIDASPAAPELPGLQNLSGPNLSLDRLIAAVCPELSKALELKLIPSQLSQELQSQRPNWRTISMDRRFGQIVVKPSGRATDL